MTLSTTHPGFPELLIASVSTAVEPYRFETCTGDAADPFARPEPIRTAAPTTTGVPTTPTHRKGPWG